MNTMTVSVFHNEKEALTAVEEIKLLEDKEKLKIWSLATVMKAEEENPKVTYIKEFEGGKMRRGLMIGGLMGVISGPLGMLIGGTVGAFTGELRDLNEEGMSSIFMEEVTKALYPGRVAIVAYIDETSESVLNQCMNDLNGLVFRRYPDEDIERQIVRESNAFEQKLLELDWMLKNENTFNRSEVLEDIEKIKEKIKIIKMKSKELLEKESERKNTKIELLSMQIPYAGEQREKKLRKRIENIEAKYENETKNLSQIYRNSDRVINAF